MHWKKGLIGPNIHEITDRKSKNPLRIQCQFGLLKIVHSRVSIVDNSTGRTIDVGMSACQAGFVKIRNISPNSKTKWNPYHNQLQECEREARKYQRGIWSKSEGFIRNLSVSYNDDQILETREFTAIVDGVTNGTSLKLFLMPNHQCIILQISGCRADSINKKNPDKNSIGWQAYQEILKKFLHKKIQVRLCQKFSNNNDGPHRFIGCVIGAPDLAFQKLISDGLARYEPKTSDYALNADEYINKEIVARNKKLGMWSVIKDEDVNVNVLPNGYPNEIQGLVTKIHSSSSLEIEQ